MTRRYEPLLKIASGGTASVWVGAATGALGFRQLVAIKRPHEHLADDPTFVAALVEEARIASRLRHANAVDVRDVEVDEFGVQLVMDWVEGASLSDLIRAWKKEPPRRSHAVAIRIVLDACEGLRALHELASDDGAPLGCVHRDVSPANVLVGLDGVGRITDFGLARPLLAVERTTSQGALRGKLGYMAPEYIRGKEIDHRVDVFAMAIVLWEAIAGRRLWRGENDAETLDRVQREPAPRLSNVAASVGPIADAIDDLLVRALAKDPAERVGSIAEFSTELERIARARDLVASHAEVRDSFGPKLRASLESRRREVQRALSASTDGPPSASVTGPPRPRSVPPASYSQPYSVPPASYSQPYSIPPASYSQPPYSQPPSYSNEYVQAFHDPSTHSKTRPGTPQALRSTTVTEDSTRNSAVVSVAGRRSTALRTAFALACGVVLVAGTVGTAVLLRSKSSRAVHASPHVVAPDVQPRLYDLRERGPGVAASSLPGWTAPSATYRRSGHPTSPPPSTSARPAPTPEAPLVDPINKAPRPNPYAH